MLDDVPSGTLIEAVGPFFCDTSFDADFTRWCSQDGVDWADMEKVSLGCCCVPELKPNRASDEMWAIC